MAKKEVVQIVAANVSALMSRAGLSIAALEKKSSGRLKKSTIDRVRRAEGSARLDSVSELARALGVETWQLCVEDLDPDALPSLVAGPSTGTPQITNEELRFLEDLRRLSGPFQHLILNDVARYLAAEIDSERSKKGGAVPRQA